MLKVRRSHILSCNLFILLLMVGCAQQPAQEISTEAATNEAVTQVEPQQAEQPQAQDTTQAEIPEAKQKMAFARSRFSMAQKGLMGYNQAVVLCRDVIKTYPGTSYEREAREILRQIPEDQRSQFKITDEELGL